jgi:hypothetical protein
LTLRAEIDPTLLTIEPEPSPGRFLILMLATLVVLAAAWAVAAPRFAALHYAPARLTSPEANLGALVKYAAAKDRNVAWVGSSLTAVLSERYFTIPGSYNLGMSGGSPVTALKILQRLEPLPKVAIVEIDVLELPVDHTLADRPWEYFSQPIVAIFANFYDPLYLIPAAIYYRPEKIRSQAQARRKALLEEPSYYRGLSASERAEAHRLEAWQANLPLEESNATEINQIKTYLQARGVKVYFINLPFPPEIQRLPFSTVPQSLVSKSAHFDCDVCIDLTRLLPMDEMGWSDGRHMNERSSVMVIDAMEKLIRGQTSLR